jgi:membrane-associated phospholipid phosphatase
MPSRPHRIAIPTCRALAVAISATAAIGATSLTDAGGAAATPVVPARPTDNVVVEWNRTLLSLVQTPGAQPATIQPTRDFAVMSSAVFTAVNAPQPARRPRGAVEAMARHGASQEAAAAQAAHDVLIALFPTFAGALDQQLVADLAAIAPGPSRAAGVQAGARAARQELKTRAADGSATPPPPYQSTGAAGDYRPTPPGFAAPVFTQWAAVTPFVLRSGNQFRPPPPPPLRSSVYAAAINEVKSLGQDHSTTRTAEQTTIADFWAAPIQNYWNAIADEVTSAQHTSVEATARTFALLDVSLADATIALYDAKYTYRLWRPVTAIRLADADDNQLTTADPTWNPLATTPADPSYPGAHSTISATAATVLTALYGDRVSFTVDSPTLPGVARSFHSFHQAATEAGLSRIYAGVHTRLDHRAGLALGNQVGRYALENAFRR